MIKISKKNENISIPASDLRQELPETSFERVAGHNNMLYLIQLRWIAVIGQIITISVAVIGYGIPLPMSGILKVLACLIAFNIGSHLRWHEERVVTNYELFFALLIDVAGLTALLYFSGGISNPFAFLYLLQVVLSVVLLETWSTWSIVLITSICLTGLGIFSEPLVLPPNHSNNLNLYIQAMLICFVINAVLLVIFITRISNNLRARDTQLSQFRQRAAEEDHIVRMGLLASGAAHELSTPLATLSVILGDWKRMPEFNQTQELQEELGVMQFQLQRCKTIVDGILLSAGETRSESLTKTTINTFLNDLADDWRETRPIESFSYDNLITKDIPVVFDRVLKQTVFNVLDNALEASPHWVALEASLQDGLLIVQIVDKGPGFTTEMLSHLGKPYQSTKGLPGSGLGLFFVVNVARKLGGTVKARNRDNGGAVVELILPLAAISLEDEEQDG